MEITQFSNEVLALTLAADEWKQDLAREQRRLESTRSTARAILASGSLIIALIAAFQIAVPATKIPPEIYTRLLVLALALYAIMIACCVIALWPVVLASPARPDGEDLYLRLKGKGEVEARQALLSAYQEADEKNKGPARRVQVWTTMGGLLLPVIVVVLLFLSFNVP